MTAGSRARSAARAGRSRPGRPSRAAADELPADLGQVGAGELARDLRCRGGTAAGTGRRPASCPAGSGSSMPSHISLVEPLRPEWPSCRPIFAVLAACTKSTMRRQPASCPGVYRPVQPGVIRPSADTQTISVITSAGAAERLAAEVGEVEVAGQAVHRGVHVHRRDDDPVLQLQPAQPERLEHRRSHLRHRRHPAARLVPGEPTVHCGYELRVAQPQVVVGDPAAAGQEVERELHRLLVHGTGRGSRTTPGWPARPAGWTAPPAAAPPRTPPAHSSTVDCSCRQAASASASSIASLVPEPMEKCAVCAASPSSTTLPCRQLLAAHRGEADPPGVVRVHLVSVEDVGEQLTHLGDRGVVALPRGEAAGGQLVEPGGPPDRVVHLHDERAAGRVVRVAVDLHHAVRRLSDVEGEGVEDPVGAEPHVLAPSDVQTPAEARRRTWPGCRS